MDILGVIIQCQTLGLYLILCLQVPCETVTETMNHFISELSRGGWGQ